MVNWQLTLESLAKAICTAFHPKNAFAILLSETRTSRKYLQSTLEEKSLQPNPQSYRSILTSVPYLTSSLESYLSWPASSLAATASLILPTFLNSNVCLLSIRNATAKVQIALFISEQSSSSRTLFTNFLNHTSVKFSLEITERSYHQHSPINGHRNLHPAIHC